jgi:hypothetical protein
LARPPLFLFPGRAPDEPIEPTVLHAACRLAAAAARLDKRIGVQEWMRRFHGVATENLPSYLSWRRTIEALSTDSVPDAWIMGAGLGPYQRSSIQERKLLVDPR